MWDSMHTVEHWEEIMMRLDRGVMAASLLALMLSPVAAFADDATATPAATTPAATAPALSLIHI